MTENYDVVIVGAGLAGLQCARLLAERGTHVLLVDRKSSLDQSIHTTGIFVRRTLEDFALPQECLILTMKANQKYFPLLDATAKLTHKFLIVSNIRPEDPSRVIGGNERVVRPRLADAKFFFDQDRKKTLESRVPQLDKVV